MINGGESCGTTCRFWWKSLEEAKRFVIAVYSFKYHAATDQREEADFLKALQSYRDATNKPVLSEEARKYKVQTEGAIREKKFDNAADLYEHALNIAPWWPEGHFNRALVRSETGDYETAVHEMKRYLLLVPNASDARAAQDKIYDWERLDSQ